MEKAELPGQGSPRGRQAWDLRWCGKMSSGKMWLLLLAPAQEVTAILLSSLVLRVIWACSEAGKTPSYLK